MAVSKSHFQFHYMIGRGGFSKVWKVEKKKDRKLFAMKEMAKARIMAKRSVSSVMNERKVLSQLHNSYKFVSLTIRRFLVNMNYAFADKENLYLVMDFLGGGDLRFHIFKRKRFSEAETSTGTAVTTYA